MEAFLVASGVVALAEMGDKTQLLGLALAARFQRPAQILLGIFVATLANHALASAVGRWLRLTLDGEILQWGLVLSFLAMAAWMLVPDRHEERERAGWRLGVFATTLVAFFLLEMGDKTQVATVALAAEYARTGAVIAGTTLGMMVANAPCVLMGNVLCAKVPEQRLRRIAASIFVVVAVTMGVRLYGF